jgi:hypothetical protein
MADGFNAIHAFSDPGLDKRNIFDYELSVRLNSDSLSYAVLDTRTNKFLHIETWEQGLPKRKPYIPGDKEPEDMGRIIELLEDDLNWLTGNFSHKRIIIDQGKSTLVPHALFKEENKEAIFNFNVAGGPYPADALRHDRLVSLNAFVVYHLPHNTKKLLEDYFSSSQVIHYSSALIQPVFLKNRNQENDQLLYVNVAASRVDIMRMKGKKLDYFNSFRYNTAEDFLYFVIFVVEQLGLNPETAELMMMGEVDKHSSLTDLMMKYVRNVSFARRNDDFRYSFVFDQLPGHYYYNLLNASLCE